MRPREAGGLEPDDADQVELSNLWHLSLTAFATPGSTRPTRPQRVDWAVDEFCKAHPEIARKWVYVWAIDNLGMVTEYRDAYVTSIARQWFGGRK